MKRGEIYYANLSPTVGSEIDKSRPVLVVSNDANNRAANTVTILPITSNITQYSSVNVFCHCELLAKQSQYLFFTWFCLYDYL